MKAVGVLLTVILAGSAFGEDHGLGPDTIFNDIPGDATLREMVTAGGGGGTGGVDTNAVRDIATDLLTQTNAADFAEAKPDSVVGRVTNDSVKLRVDDGTLYLMDGDDVVWKSSDAGITQDILTKTNVLDFTEVEEDSIVGRVTNEDVKLRVEDGTLYLYDHETVVWRSSDGGIGVDMLTKTNALDFADASPSSIVGRVTNEDIRMRVEDDTLEIRDRTNSVWRSDTSNFRITSGFLTQTNADAFAADASARPDSIVGRLSNTNVILSVDSDTLVLKDGTNVMWSSRNEIESAKASLRSDMEAGDLAAITSANAYTDSSIASNAAAIKIEMDAGDLASVSSANAYTDSSITSNTASLRADMEAGDLASVVAANSHTDSSVNSAKAVLQSAIAAGDQNAVASANAHADSAIESAKTDLRADIESGDEDSVAAAKSYTDGMVSGFVRKAGDTVTGMMHFNGAVQFKSVVAVEPEASVNFAGDALMDSGSVLKFSDPDSAFRLAFSGGAHEDQDIGNYETLDERIARKTPQPPDVSAKRDLTDNLCRKDEFFGSSETGWDFSEQEAKAMMPYSAATKAFQIEAGVYAYRVQLGMNGSYPIGEWGLLDSGPEYFETEAACNTALANASVITWQGPIMRGTKTTRLPGGTKSAVSNETYVTTSFVTNQITEALSFRKLRMYDEGQQCWCTVRLSNGALVIERED